MIEGLFLASQGYFGGYYGGAFGSLLATWEQAGIFSYVLPFLIIFALIFGILTQVNLFKDNRAINAILAFSIGLLSLQFDFVPIFFSELFPRVGVGLAIILIILIFTSLFTNPSDKWQMYILWAVSAIVVVVILMQTAWFTGFGYSSYLPFLGYYWKEIFSVLVFLVVIFVVIISARPKSTTPMNAPVARLLSGALGEVDPNAKK